jgi:type I restriction enzyme S subunit
MDGNHGGDYPRKSEFIEEGVPYVSANCITGDSLDMSKAKFLSPDRAAKLRKGFAQSGDVIFAHNATVGPVAILRTHHPTVVLGTSVTYYRCNTEFISPEYLAHYMRSSDFVRQYQAVMRQSTRNQVPITKQRTFCHVIPPIEVQRDLATTLDDLGSQVALLQSSYCEKINVLSNLKQSLLQKAFTGELTSDKKAADRTLSEAGL